MPNVSSTIISVQSSRRTLLNIITPFYSLSDSSKSMIQSTDVTIKTLTYNILSGIIQYKEDSKFIYNFIQDTIVSLNLTDSDRERYFTSFDKAKSYLSLTFSFFTIIPSIVLVWIFLVYIFGKKNHGNCLLIFIFYVLFGFGIYIIISGIQFSASISLNQACTRAPSVALTIDKYFDKIPTIAGNISIQDTIIGLSKCKDNETLLDVANYNINALNIKNNIKEFLNQGNQTIQSIDLGQFLSGNIIDQVNSFKEIISNARVNYTQDLDNYQNSIQIIEYQLLNPSYQGYNETFYNNTFIELNQKSVEIGGIIWNETTIDQLDLFSSPYKYYPDFFPPRKYFLIGFRDLRNILRGYAYNLSLINQDLENIKQSLNIIEDNRQKLLLIPDQIIFEIQSIINIVNNLKKLFLTILNQFNDLLDYSYNQIYQLLKCKSIGYYFNVLGTDFCKNCYTFIILGCLGSILMGIFMCMMFPVLLEMKKRMENPKEKHIEWKELIEGDHDKIELNRPSTDLTSPRISQEEYSRVSIDKLIQSQEPKENLQIN